MPISRADCFFGIYFERCPCSLLSVSLLSFRVSANGWLPILFPFWSSARAPFSWVPTGSLDSPVFQARSIHTATWQMAPEQGDFVLSTPAGSLIYQLIRLTSCLCARRTKKPFRRRRNYEASSEEQKPKYLWKRDSEAMARRWDSDCKVDANEWTHISRSRNESIGWSSIPHATAGRIWFLNNSWVGMKKCREWKRKKIAWIAVNNPRYEERPT